MPDDTAPPATTPRKHPAHWLPGQSGNPAGRPKGSRHAALLALDAIGAEGAEAALRKLVAMSLEGDVRALEILMRRLWPERKGRPVEIDLPEMRTAADLVGGLAAVAQSVAGGDLSPEEGAAVAAILETQRRAVETVDLERRLSEMERHLRTGMKS